MLTKVVYRDGMVPLRLIQRNNDSSEELSTDLRQATRSRRLLKTSIRVRGEDADFAIIVRDISSTGLKATTASALFAGTRIEVELLNLGWVSGEVVWAGCRGQVGVRFSCVINPDVTHVRISGSYGSMPKKRGQLRRL